MEQKKKTSGNNNDDVIPQKYSVEFVGLLDSHNKFDLDIKKVLFHLGKEESRSFLYELKRWLDLEMQEAYYDEKFVKPREMNSPRLAKWELECALSEDHISLRIENYGDYVGDKEYPATDEWIDRKKKELANFFLQRLPILIEKKTKDITETQPDQAAPYSFPSHLIATDFQENNLVNKTFQITTERSYAELQEILMEFKELLDQKSFYALIHNMFEFPGNPYDRPIVLSLQLRNKKNRGALKHLFLTLYENFYRHFKRGIDKEVFGKILFCNFWEDRKGYIKKRKDFKLHIENLTKSIRKDTRKSQ